MNTFNLENLKSLELTEFEKLIKSLLENMGFSDIATKDIKEDGIDIIAVNEQPIIGGKYVIKFKWNEKENNVDEQTIMELFNAMKAENANKSIFITTSDFAEEAFTFAQDKTIELINGNALLELFNKHLKNSELPKEPSSEIDIKASERFSDEIYTFLEKEKLLAQKRYLNIDEYIKLIRMDGENWLELLDIVEYIDNIIIDIFEMAIKSPNVDEQAEYFCAKFNLTKIGFVDSHKEVYFTVVDSFLKRALDLYKTFTSVIPPKEAINYHENLINIIKLNYRILSAIKQSSDDKEYLSFVIFADKLVLNQVLDKFEKASDILKAEVAKKK